MKRFFLTLIVTLVLVLILLLGNNQVYAESIRGVVSDANNKPISGLLVSIISPNGKRLISTNTDNDGQYFITGLPRDSRPFYLEVYWNYTLIYRRTFNLSGDVVRDITIK